MIEDSVSPDQVKNKRIRSNHFGELFSNMYSTFFFPVTLQWPILEKLSCSQRDICKNVHGSIMLIAKYQKQFKCP